MIRALSVLRATVAGAAATLLSQHGVSSCGFEKLPWHFNVNMVAGRNRKYGTIRYLHSKTNSSEISVSMVANLVDGYQTSS